MRVYRYECPERGKLDAKAAIGHSTEANDVPGHHPLDDREGLAELEVDSALGPVRRRHTTEPDLAGHRVGDSYVLIDAIGRGATGIVWRAYDHLSGEEVAVKLLRPDLVRQPKAVTRFLQEREILQDLRHDNIVRVRALFSANESIGLVMDLVAGGSLRDYLLHHTTLPPAEAAALLAQVASALAAAHATDVVHRDLKPDNILLDRSSGTTTARLTDFGIARVLDAPNLTTHEALIGTPNYMAPELINGARPTPAADVYSLGVLLYELVVGRQPFAGGAAVAVLRRHLDDAPFRPQGLPDAVWSVIELCLDKDPSRRPPAEELVTTLLSLAHLTAGVPALAPPSVDDDEFCQSVRSHLSIRSHLYLNAATDAPEDGRTRSPRRRRFTIALIAVGAMLIPGLSDAPGMGLFALGEKASPHTAVVQVVTTPQPVLSSAPPSTLPSSAAPKRSTSLVTRSPAPAPPPPSTAVPFGPLVCADRASNGGGLRFHATPCYSLGQTIRLVGQLLLSGDLVLPLLSVDMSIWLEEAGNGKKVTGSYNCRGLILTLAVPAACGPFDLGTPPVHGRQYVVAMEWTILVLGKKVTNRGTAFNW